MQTSADIYVANASMLEANTARGEHMKDEGTNPKLAPLASMIEGILSLHQLVSVVLAEKIPGVETGDQALRLLLDGSNGRLGLASNITMRLAMGTIGPIAQSGRYFHHPLDLKDGRLVVSDEFADFLKKKRGDRIEVCPFAGLFGKKQPGEVSNPTELKTPIQQIAEIYFRVFNLVDAVGVSTHFERSW